MGFQKESWLANLLSYFIRVFGKPHWMDGDAYNGKGCCNHQIYGLINIMTLKSTSITYLSSHNQCVTEFTQSHIGGFRLHFMWYISLRYFWDMHLRYLANLTKGEYKRGASYPRYHWVDSSGRVHRKSSLSSDHYRMKYKVKASMVNHIHITVH